MIDTAPATDDVDEDGDVVVAPSEADGDVRLSLSGSTTVASANVISAHILATPRLKTGRHGATGTVT